MIYCVAGIIGGQPQLQPTFNIHVELGRGAATWTGDGIAFQQKVPVTRHVGFEVCQADSNTICVVHVMHAYSMIGRLLLLCLAL